MLGENIKISYV